MRARRRWLRTMAWGLVPGGLSTSGCLATLERNLDYMLAPDALENTLFLPFSEIASLARALLDFLT